MKLSPSLGTSAVLHFCGVSSHISPANEAVRKKGHIANVVLNWGTEIKGSKVFLFRQHCQTLLTVLTQSLIHKVRVKNLPKCWQSWEGDCSIICEVLKPRSLKYFSIFFLFNSCWMKHLNKSISWFWPGFICDFWAFWFGKTMINSFWMEATFLFEILWSGTRSYAPLYMFCSNKGAMDWELCVAVQLFPHKSFIWMKGDCSC